METQSFFSVALRIYKLRESIACTLKFSSAPLSYHPNSHHKTQEWIENPNSHVRSFQNANVFPSKCLIWYTSRSNAAALNNTVVLFQHQTSLGCSLVSMPSNHATCYVIFCSTSGFLAFSYGWENPSLAHQLCSLHSLEQVVQSKVECNVLITSLTRHVSVPLLVGDATITKDLQQRNCSHGSLNLSLCCSQHQVLKIMKLLVQLVFFMLQIRFTCNAAHNDSTMHWS